jgi:hypothetical protein
MAQSLAGVSAPIPAPAAYSGASASRNFLAQPAPLWTIFATFPLVTLPLAAVGLSDLPPAARTLIYDVYLCLFGLTHFFLTFAVYMNADNLAHYRESTRNRLIYFYVPLAIFLFFPIFFGSGIADIYPTAAGLVLIAVRFANYRHLTRQAYGVSRVLGRSHALQAPKWLAIAEHGLLSFLTLLMFLTFLYGGEFTWEPMLVKATLAVSVVFGVLVAAGYARAAAASKQPSAVFAPVTYMVLQIASIALAVYRSELYIATLAIHYVEYHVLMIPRCFETSLRTDSPVDRFFAAVRTNRVVFYGGLVVLAVLFMAVRKAAEIGGGPTTLYMFDALFVFHYFVESFIWKFSVPHYRQALGPLYFGSR